MNVGIAILEFRVLQSMRLGWPLIPGRSPSEGSPGQVTAFLQEDGLPGFDRFYVLFLSICLPMSL